MVNNRQLHYTISIQYNKCKFICILLSPKLSSGNVWFCQNYIETIMEIIYEDPDLKDTGGSTESVTCCKSKYSLLFKQHLNNKYVTYTTKLHLRKSLTALLTSDMSMTDIAYEYSFCTASYYREIFRKYYGMSPLAYRETGEH